MSVSVTMSCVSLALVCERNLEHLGFEVENALECECYRVFLELELRPQSELLHGRHVKESSKFEVICCVIDDIEFRTLHFRFDSWHSFSTYH